MHSTTYIKVSGYEGLARDSSSGAIISTSTSEYSDYINARNKAISREMEISKQSEEINNIKQDISEIKDLLHKLLANKG